MLFGLEKCLSVKNCKLLTCSCAEVCGPKRTLDITLGSCYEFSDGHISIVLLFIHNTSHYRWVRPIRFFIICAHHASYALSAAAILISSNWTNSWRPSIDYNIVVWSGRWSQMNRLVVRRGSEISNRHSGNPITSPPSPSTDNDRDRSKKRQNYLRRVGTRT